MEMPEKLRVISEYDIVLASGSPRRRELLSQFGLPFRVVSAGDVDESFDPATPADEVAPMLALRKATHYLNTALTDNQLAICADTVVIIDGRVLGKPADEAEAVSMLRTLSGRPHRVITGVALAWRDAEGQQRTMLDSAVTEVSFARLTDDEIRWYVTHYRPLDKAGAYGIQEWIGAVAVESLNGSYSNVMGLPLHLVYQMLTAVKG